MLVLQQIDVLPNGCNIEIKDGNKLELLCFKSIIDGSLSFETAKEADRYYKCLSTYHVFKTDFNIHDYGQEYNKWFSIQIREGFDNESERAACSSS